MQKRERGCASLNGMELYPDEICYNMTAALSPEDFARLRLEFLWVYEAPVPHCGKWSREIMVPDGVFFVLEGQAKLKAGAVTVVAGAGQAFFGRQGVRRQWFAEGTRLLSVGFRASWLHHGPLVKHGLNCVMECRAFAPLRNATYRLLKKVHPQKRSIDFKEASEPRSLELAQWLDRERAFREWFACYLDALESSGVSPDHPRSFGDPRLAAVLRCLDEWPLTRKLDVAELMVLSGCSHGRRRLEQLMCRHIGMSPFAYLERRRLAVACDELISGSRTIKELAFDLGFQYASHFTKWFQRLAGLTPSAYRLATMGAV